MPKKRNMTSEKVARVDEWSNRMTGINIKGRDKRHATEAVSYCLKEAEAEAIYAGDYLAAKMVDTLPEDMVREGFKFIIPDLKEEDIRKLYEYLEANLDWKGHMQEALSWARLYGGSCLLLGIDDGQDALDKELQWNNIKRFDFITLFNRWELQHSEMQKDPTKPGYGLPAKYTITNSESADVRIRGKSLQKNVIHASRLIRFDGCHLPRREFRRNGYWHDSILSKRKLALADYGIAFDSTASLMGNVSQAVFKVKNLIEILATEDGRTLLTKRFNLMEECMSVIGAIMLDGEEDFERKTTSLSGIDVILTKMENRLVATSEYPHTILLGEAPGSGLGETGKSELRDYYDSVKRKQETELKPALRVIIKAMFLDKNGPTKGKEPESWDIEFNPLWQDTLEATLEQRHKQAMIDQIHIQTGVASPDEIAESRFGSGTYSHETTLAYERIEDEGDAVSSDTQENSDPGKEAKKPKLAVVPPGATAPKVANPMEGLAKNQTTSAQVSLNGSQVTSLMEIITQVASGLIPRETGVNLIKIAFALSQEDAESIMGEVGRGFKANPPVQSTPPKRDADDDNDDDLRNLRQ